MNWACCVLRTIIVGVPRSTVSLFFNDIWQTCLRNGKTLKVFLYAEFCPLCDKQIIASAKCIFKVFQKFFKFFSRSFSKFSKLPLSPRASGNFVKTMKIHVKLILNCPRAHEITYAKWNFSMGKEGFKLTNLHKTDIRAHYTEFP